MEKDRIIITEETLREIVSNCIDDWCSRYQNDIPCNVEDVVSYQMFKKRIINEMAFKRKDFVNHIASLRCQLIENWCLCAYCKLYDEWNENFNHWKCEFIAHSDNIKNCKLKDGDKGKVIKQTYIDTFDLNDPSMIKQIIRGKFIRECIDDVCMETIAQMCASNALTLVKFLSTSNYPSEEYVSITFDS